MTNYGLIGCGRFGEFCLGAIGAQSGLRATAVADENLGSAQELGGAYRLPASDVESLLANPQVEVVHIATPPWTHAGLTRKALLAGKHVLCEKPLALSGDDADELVHLAGLHGRKLVVNHLLRYNPLLQLVKGILDSGALGRPRHAFLENYATDERLEAGHWFWDRQRSGGIFVEHGVHFFDLHRWWFGAARVVGACQVERAPGQVEQVSSLALHGDGVSTHCYHSFDQPAPLDRADHRLVFERGELRISGWIPQRMELDALVTQVEKAQLTALGGWTRQSETTLAERSQRGRGQSYELDLRLGWVAELECSKSELYQAMFLKLLADQFGSGDCSWSGLADDAAAAVRTAEAATLLAAGSVR